MRALAGGDCVLATISGALLRATASKLLPRGRSSKSTFTPPSTYRVRQSTIVGRDVFSSFGQSVVASAGHAARDRSLPCRGCGAAPRADKPPAPPGNGRRCPVEFGYLGSVRLARSPHTFHQTISRTRTAAAFPSVIGGPARNGPASCVSSGLGATQHQVYQGRVGSALKARSLAATREISVPPSAVSVRWYAAAACDGLERPTPRPGPVKIRRNP